MKRVTISKKFFGVEQGKEKHRRKQCFSFGVCDFDYLMMSQPMYFLKTSGTVMVPSAF